MTSGIEDMHLHTLNQAPPSEPLVF